jgi:lathosterol oxidase
VAEDSFLNGAAHHTVHHREFNYNYGQYFTLWDRIGGSYKRPEEAFEEKHAGKHSLSGRVAVEPGSEEEEKRDVLTQQNGPATSRTSARLRTRKDQ